MIPAANPITRAAENMSFAPAMNSLAMLSAEFPEAMPAAIPRAMKRAQISGRYQPYPITPTTMKRMVNIRRVRMYIWVELRSDRRLDSTKRASAVQRSHGAANSPWPILTTHPEA